MTRNPPDNYGLVRSGACTRLCLFACETIACVRRPLPFSDLIAVNLDPYKPVRDVPSRSRRRFVGRYMFTGIAFGVFAAVIIPPGLMMATINCGLFNKNVRRYATYDPELFVLGFPVSESTAYAVTFIAGPGLLLASLMCFWAHRRSRLLALPDNYGSP